MAKRFPKKPARGPNQPRIIQVDGSLATQSLVAALHQCLDQSWGQARRLIEKRQVQVNGNLCLDAGRRLTVGEVLHVFPHPLALPPQENSVKIRFIDEHIVVVDKPSGMTTLRHPEERFWPAERRQRQPTLEECLNRIVAKRERPRAGGPRTPPRVRPVHRLDRDTSGLMVFARSVKAERLLIGQFAQHSIVRRYQAIVAGPVKSMTIDSVLVRDRGDGRRGSSDDEVVGQGKRAVTHVRAIESLGEYTLVECRLETGRTHQIRIHLSEKGHPVCGDKVYSAKRFARSKSDNSGAPRLALHACELGFVHPMSQETMHFEWPLPQDLAVFLRSLRDSAKK